MANCVHNRTTQQDVLLTAFTLLKGFTTEQHLLPAITLHCISSVHQTVEYSYSLSFI